MTISPRRILILGSVGLLVFAILWASLILFAGVPDLGAQVPEPPAIVSITIPIEGSVYPNGLPLEIRASAASEDELQAIELWADGTRIERTELDPAAGRVLRNGWYWTPQTVGSHVLIVKTEDTAGRIAISEPVTIRSSTTHQGVMLEPRVLEEGQSLEDLAGDSGVSVEDILAYNSPADTGGFQPGDSIDIPAPMPFPLPVPVTESPPDPQAFETSADDPPPAPSPLVYWLGGLFSSGSEPLPAAPDLIGEVDGCNVRLQLIDSGGDEAGFFLYRFEPTTAAFDEIAAFGPLADGDGLSFEDPGLFGTYTYLAASFNQAGESPGSIQTLTIDDAACGLIGWEGIQIVDGQVQLPEPVEFGHFYFAFDGGGWQRVPRDKNEFLIAVDGRFDARPFLDQLSLDPGPTAGGTGQLAEGLTGGTLSLSLKVWGYRGGELVFLGDGSGQLRSPQAGFGDESPFDWTELYIGTALGTDVENLHTERTFSPLDVAEWEFRWDTGSPIARSGLWQVSKFPFPESFDPDPPGLLVDGRVEGTGSDFIIDFRPIYAVLLGEIAKEDPSTSAELPSDLVLLPQYKIPMSEPVYRPIVLEPLSPNRLFVRITPMDGTKPAGAPSNAVILNYTPEFPETPFFDLPLPTEPLYQARILAFDAPVFQDPNRWGCLEVVGYDENAPPIIGVNGQPIELSDLYPEMVYCPESYRGAGGFDLLEAIKEGFDLLGQGWDWLVERFNELKSFVVEIMVLFSPQICAQIDLARDLANDAGVEADFTCEDVMEAAVDAALIAHGVPPTLPKYEELTDKGLDYLVELAAEEIEQKTGVPCDATCKDLLRDGFEAGLDELENLAVQPGCIGEDEAHRHGREPLCMPAGVVTKPATGAVFQPAVLEVQVTRDPNVPDPEAPYYPRCSLDAGVAGSRVYEGKTVFGPGSRTMVVETQEISGTLFEPVSARLTRMEAGESLEIVLVFDRFRPYKLPWTDEQYARSQILPNLMNDWYTLYNGANANIVLDGSAAFEIPHIPIHHLGYQCVEGDSMKLQLPRP